MAKFTRRGKARALRATGWFSPAADINRCGRDADACVRASEHRTGFTLLPTEQVRFLAGPLISFVGTRNRQLRPSVGSVSAVRPDAAADTISFVLPDNEGARTKSDIADNGLIALTVIEPRSHETYQFKGRHLSSRPGNERDRALVDIQMAKIVARLNEAHYPGDKFGRYVFWPGTIVTFHVEDIFIQTPGPSAGKRIDFQPGPR